MSDLSGQRKSIMVVDDAALNLKILSETLKSEYDVTLFSSGEEALSAVRGLKPDLILLDVLMPGMGGYEVCRKLKSDELTRSIPVMFLTALTEEMEETRGLALGAVDYITKPISIPILLLRIKTQLQLIEQTNKLKETLLISQQNRVQEDKTPQDLLTLAASIQRNFQVKPLPQSELLNSYVCYNPRKEVSSDVYETLRHREKDIGFFIGDTSSKGVSAVLKNILVQKLLHESHSHSKSPGFFLQDLNNAILNKLKNVMITGFYGVVTYPEREFHFANAGHPQPLIFKSATGKIEFLSKGGLPMGAIQSEMPYQAWSIKLSKGDRILMYSDGLVQGMKAQKDSAPPLLKDIYARHLDKGLKDGALSLISELEESNGVRDEDITVIALEIL